MNNLIHSVQGCDEFTSRLWGAAAEQLELQVVGAEAVTLQVLQQLLESGPQSVRAVQTEAFFGHVDLEVLVLANGAGLLQVDLDEEKGFFFCQYTTVHNKKAKKAQSRNTLIYLILSLTLIVYFFKAIITFNSSFFKQASVSDSADTPTNKRNVITKHLFRPCIALCTKKTTVICHVCIL